MNVWGRVLSVYLPLEIVAVRMFQWLFFTLSDS